MKDLLISPWLTSLSFWQWPKDHKKKPFFDVTQSNATKLPIIIIIMFYIHIQKYRLKYKNINRLL